MYAKQYLILALSLLISGCSTTSTHRSIARDAGYMNEKGAVLLLRSVEGENSEIKIELWQCPLFANLDFPEPNCVARGDLLKTYTPTELRVRLLDLASDERTQSTDPAVARLLSTYQNDPYKVRNILDDQDYALALRDQANELKKSSRQKNAKLDAEWISQIHQRIEATQKKIQQISEKSPDLVQAHRTVRMIIDGFIHSAADPDLRASKNLYANYEGSGIIVNGALASDPVMKAILDRWVHEVCGKPCTSPQLRKSSPSYE